MPSDEDVRALINATKVLGAPETWNKPPPCHGLALAIIESIWSIGVRYEGVENVVARYLAVRDEQGHNADEDTPHDLVEFIENLGGPEAFADCVENRQRTSSKGGILKAEAVFMQARMLADASIHVPEDVLATDAERLEEVSARWATVSGQGSLISWHYFLMRAGRSGVKPDRMIRRFIAEALGRSSSDAVGVEEATRLVTAAAAGLGVDVGDLDFAIWEHQREQATADDC